MDLDTLYKIYGSQMINLEILQGQIQQTKQQIAEALNKANAQPAPAAPAEGQ